MTTLPTWAVYAVSLGTPAAAFLSVLVAQWITRTGARELETRSRREETMRAALDAVSRTQRLSSTSWARMRRRSSTWKMSMWSKIESDPVLAQRE